MILIFYALRRELSGLRKRIAQRAPLGQGLRGFKGRLGDEQIFLVATGIGVAQAHESARRAMLTLPRPRLVISTGVAGALAPDLKAGHLVLADRLLLEESPDSSFEEVARLSPDLERPVRDTLGRAGLTGDIEDLPDGCFRASGARFAMALITLPGPGWPWEDGR